ncbi:MAG: DUF6340 family protein, partial [Tannerella sp.]|nr:DUF6340 family protein [Tannerella sp.]
MLHPSYAIAILRTCVLALFLSSCSTLHYIEVESQYPAAITFPEELSRILIVNNALPQESVPLESSIRVVRDTVTFKADSAAFDFCRTLGEELAAHQAFTDVRLLEGCFRKDDSPLSAVTLKREEVEQLTWEHDVDAVISLDRLLFKVNEYTHELSVLDVFSAVDIYVSGVLRVYIPGRDTPMTSFLLVDTITPDLLFDWKDMISDNSTYLIDVEEFIRESADFVAYEARKNFVPYWSQDVRWYYVWIGTKWKQASAYAQVDRWPEALAIWKELDAQSTSWKQKA